MTGMFKSGIFLAFLAFAFFAISDACVKGLHGHIPPYQLAFFGSAFSILVLPMAWRRGDTALDLVRAKRPWLWVLRGALAISGSLTSIIAFTRLPMAEAFALIFLMPLVVTALSVWLLKEPVTVKSWLAITLGFIGVLIVLRPGFRHIDIGHLAALACGFIAAFLSVLLRITAPHEKPITLFGAGNLFPVVISGLLSLGSFVTPTLTQWFVIAGYAVLAAAANVLIAFASRKSPASRIAPTQYSQMLWGIGLGYIFFQDRVDLVTALGAAVIVGAGIWLFMPTRRQPPASSGDD
jgi:S-adenosylmethionine uptake transporter